MLIGSTPATVLSAMMLPPPMFPISNENESPTMFSIGFVWNDDTPAATRHAPRARAHAPRPEGATQTLTVPQASARRGTIPCPCWARRIPRGPPPPDPPWRRMRAGAGGRTRRRTMSSIFAAGRRTWCVFFIFGFVCSFVCFLTFPYDFYTFQYAMMGEGMKGRGRGGEMRKKTTGIQQRGGDMPKWVGGWMDG